jgi:hypothetical protein
MSDRSISPELSSVKINDSYDIRNDEITDDFFLSYENITENSPTIATFTYNDESSPANARSSRDTHRAGFTPISDRSISPELHKDAGAKNEQRRTSYSRNATSGACSELRKDAGAKNERRGASYSRNATSGACSELRKDAGAKNERRVASYSRNDTTGSCSELYQTSTPPTTAKYQQQEQHFLQKINNHLHQLSQPMFPSSRPHHPPPPPPSSPELLKADGATSAKNEEKQTSLAEHTETSGFSKYTKKTDSMLFHQSSSLPDAANREEDSSQIQMNVVISASAQTSAPTDPPPPTLATSSSGLGIHHPTPINLRHTREKLLNAFIYSNSPVSSNPNSDSDMSDNETDQRPAAQVFRSGNFAKDANDDNYLIREHAENAFTKRNVRFKKISYEEIERSLSKYYDKNNKYSNEVDILITFMRGQKHLYNQSCYITQMKLYMLTITALAITSFITVVAPFIQRYWWSSIFVMSGNAIATILITILKYMRYESSCNTFTLIANHYDHYEHILELTTNKLVFVHDESEQSRIVLEKMREIEFKMSETKELCPIIIPSEVQSTYPVIFQTNIFTLIKKMDLHRKTLILQLKNIKNEIRYILYKWNSIPNTDDEETLLHLADTTFHNISNHPQMQREKIRLLFLMEQKEIVKKELCEYKNNYSQIDDLFMKEIKYAEMNRHWSRVLFCDAKKIQYQSYTNPVIKEHLELILAN